MNRGNMAYNFDFSIDRRHSDSIKWKIYPEEILPMWWQIWIFSLHLQSLKLCKTGSAMVCLDTLSIPDLDEIVVAWVRDHYHMPVDQKRSCYVPGVVTGFNMVAKAFLKEKDGVMFQPPIYPLFLNWKRMEALKATALTWYRTKRGGMESTWRLWNGVCARTRRCSYYAIP
jgi:cystathionine beta-lyase